MIFALHGDGGVQVTIGNFKTAKDTQSVKFMKLCSLGPFL